MKRQKRGGKLLLCSSLHNLQCLVRYVTAEGDFSPEKVCWGEVTSYMVRSDVVHESLTHDTKGNISQHQSEIYRFTSLSGMALFACLFVFLSFLSFCLFLEGSFVSQPGLKLAVML